MVTQTEKITISVPRNLLVLADEIAKERKTSRSRVVSSCLKEMAERYQQERMAEGYQKMAREHREFARKSRPLVKEILHEWK